MRQIGGGLLEALIHGARYVLTDYNDSLQAVLRRLIHCILRAAAGQGLPHRARAAKLTCSMDSICAIAATIASLMGADSPADCSAAPIGDVIRYASRAGIDTVERSLIFTPDAVGTGLRRRHAHLFLPVRRDAPIEVGLRSVVPPKTPVCYASMFTGAPPAVHGITTYIKKPPASESIFDTLDHAGKRAAIVAVKDSSLDTIFRGTPAEHFSEASDRAVTECARDLVAAGRHHLIVAYHQAYDDILHAAHPESPSALEAVGRHIADFGSLAQAARRHWGGDHYLVALAPDHGAHFDASLGTGSHGADIPEDMEVTHFFGLS